MNIPIKPIPIVIADLSAIESLILKTIAKISIIIGNTT